VFVRFVVNETDRRSGKRRGVFQAAYALRGSGRLPGYDHDRLTAALDWFDEHLRKPSRLARSRRPHCETDASCWFKSGAPEHLARMREVQHLLDAYGIGVDMITSRRPGYIVYEDAFQVAAYPFGETQA
jgi:hypothetical protein